MKGWVWACDPSHGMRRTEARDHRRQAAHSAHRTVSRFPGGVEGGEGGGVTVSGGGGEAGGERGDGGRANDGGCMRARAEDGGEG
eukprot:2378449-Prymnesium_polylepis.1